MLERVVLYFYVVLTGVSLLLQQPIALAVAP
jgi:hypothetical protein